MVRKPLDRDNVINLDGPEGNVFFLIGVARKACRTLGLDTDKVIEEMTAGDYIGALKVFESNFGKYYVLETENENYLEALSK